MWKHKPLVFLVSPGLSSVEKIVFGTTSRLNTFVKNTALLKVENLVTLQCPTYLNTTLLFHHHLFFP